MKGPAPVAAAGAVLALAASVLALVGCTPTDAAPPRITAAQRLAATREQLDDRWQQFTGGNGGFVNRPRVPVVRFTTYEDTNQTFATCMTKAGYKTVWDAQRGLIGPSVGADQRIQYGVAKYICQAEYPQDPVELGYLTAAQASYVYAYWKNQLIPCLRREGVSVPALPPAPRYHEGEVWTGPAWNPYENVRSERGDAIAPLVFAQCPVYPAELYSG